MTYLKFETLPDGVWPIRDYRSLGCSLVECDHADRRPMLVWSSIEIPEGRIESAIEDPAGKQICRVCKTTDFSRPVKMLAVIPNAAPQGSLF